MRIIEIVPTLEDEASGPSYSVPRLAKALADQAHDVTLMSVGAQAAGLEISVPQKRYHHDFGGMRGPRSLFLSREMSADLKLEAPKADIIHSHGLWVMPNVYPAWAAHRAGKHYVVSPRGTLGAVPLTYSRNIKRIFWRLLQGGAVARAACLHATSDSEYREIRNFGLKQPVAIIPNGIDMPVIAPKPPGRPMRTLLYLGRLHQKKGLETLLEVWQSVGPRFPDWELRIVGYGTEAYTKALQDQARALALERVEFAGPRYAAQKAGEYAMADLFILPSLNENFGMTVAEALAQAVPVIATTGTPWAGIEKQDCGWWVAPDAKGIETALTEALAMPPEQRARKGENGRAWMARDFSWDRIGRDMAEVYSWLVHGGTPPATVRLN